MALTVLALLLERMAEHSAGDTWRNIGHGLRGIKLVKIRGSQGLLWRVARPRPTASRLLKEMKIKVPKPILRLD